VSERGGGVAGGGRVCRLRYRSEGEDWEVTAGDEPLLIGRAPDCHVVLHHESVSRHHARVWRSRQGWVITDLQSKNGVKVNSFRAVQKGLNDGDQIDLGSVRLQVCIDPASPTAPARVRFENSRDPRPQTEFIDMGELDSLLSRRDAATDVSRTAISLEEIEQAGKALAGIVTSPGINTRQSGAVWAARLGPLRLFRQASEALLTGESLDETLEQILALVFNNLPAERGVICLYDEETDTSEPRATRTREGTPDDPIVISTHIVSDVIEHRQSVLVTDSHSDRRYSDAESIVNLRIRTAMCAPLYREGRVVGFIYVDRQRPERSFEIEHLQALSTLAVLSVVAVEQAALRDRIRHEKEIRARLARYSSPAVVERIVQAAGAASRGMSAEETELSVLFADLTGFTSMAERLAPGEVVQVLNQVFERLTEAVFALDGTLDKFRGDGMMAFFGAPLQLDDHAERAVEAALRMQEMIEEWSARSLRAGRLAIRIGINSGTVVVGDIGSPQRKDYTVIGDAVNIASRLESFVAEPGQVVIGHETRSRLGEKLRCSALEEVRLRGKRQVVRPYLVLGRAVKPSPG
jgi:adenylate cyclase